MTWRGSSLCRIVGDEAPLALCAAAAATMGRLTADVIARSPAFLNALKERELDLRGEHAKPPARSLHNTQGKTVCALAHDWRARAWFCLIVAGNKIAVMENLAATQDQFDSLDLSDNEIKKVECMAMLKRLTQLLLNNNRVNRLSEGLGKMLPKLETLVLTNNQLATLTELEPLAHVPTLTTLILTDNPVTHVKDYRAFVIAMLPRLKVLDYRRVKLAERDAAETAFRRTRRPQQLKGPGGASGETLAVESSNGADESLAPKAAPTAEQIAQVRAAIGAASSLEEVQKLERALKAGNFELIATAAAAAAAEAEAAE